METEQRFEHQSTPAPTPAADARDLHRLYARPQLEAVLHRERCRADRLHGEFSLVLFGCRDDDPQGTIRLARLLLRRARSTDELGWFERTIIALVLPHTSADGARAFAQAALKQAQAEQIPAICRIYTYPSAWYFDDNSPPHNGAGRNGDHDHHPLAGRNGNGKSNGHRASASPDREDDTNGNGHESGNGDGHGHSNGNGHGSGNGHGNAHGVAERATLDARDLMPFVLQGMSDTLVSPQFCPTEVAGLLVRRLPRWKRALDIAGASAGLVALSPLMILAAILIKGTSRGPVIFRQRRAGLGGRPFWIYKFRTMTVDAEARKAELRPRSEQDGPAFKMRDDPRLTPIGRILRETSLDELPQLWNVLKGDMSLVGPRPLPLDEAAECQQWQRRRLDVTPGLTCIWQVKGRSRVTFSEWMRMDVQYIRRRTLLHDVKILSQTIPAVLMRRGAK